MTCEESIKWLDSLIKALGQSQYQSLWNWEQPLTEIKEMLESKRVIELPCKVGDTAYCIWNFNEPEIQECVVKEFRFQCNGMYICLAYVDCIGQYNHSSFLIRNLNKTWFLTKSEAEQKLKELNANG